MKKDIPSWYKGPRTRAGASTVGDFATRVQKQREFCDGCNACIPSAIGYHGCSEGVNTSTLVSTGDITEQHILEHADSRCVKKQQN